MVEMLWHRLGIRRQTEKTNLNLNIGRNQSARINFDMDSLRAGDYREWCPK